MPDEPANSGEAAEEDVRGGPSQPLTHRQTQARERGQYLCEYCGDMFVFDNSRRRHEFRSCARNPALAEQFRCRFCGRTFGTIHWRVRHERACLKREEEEEGGCDVS